MPKIPNGNNNSNSLVKEENIDRPFQFETMMKELNEQERGKVKFTCTQLDDEDNSNETDLILNQKNNNKVPIQQYQNMYHANSLPSIDSITSQQQQQQMQHHQSTAINNNNNNNQHIEMDWNDTDFLKLFESDHLFNSNHTNGNSNVYSNQTQSSFIINNNNNNLKQNANNEDSSILNFDLNHQYNNNGTKIIDSSLKTCIFNENDNNNVNMINNNSNNHHQAMNNNTNNNNANTNNNNNNNNMMMPWEFNDDFNQIASYMQSPTV